MIKDRLGDLVGEVDNDDDVDYQMSMVGEADSSSMQAFLAEAEELRRMISSIESHVAEAKRLHSDILSAPHADEKLKTRLEDLTADIRRTANVVRGRMKLMQPDDDDDDRAADKADLRIRRTQHAALTRLFVDAMLAYNRAQQEHRDRCKARIKRQLEITGRATSDDELEDMLEQGDAAVFTQGIVVETRQAMRQTYADIEARHADIVKLENSIRELNAMFMDMAVLVESQGELVDNIEHHVSKTRDFVADGARDIEHGKKYQSKARRKIIFIAVCLLVVVVIILVAVLC